MKVICIKGVDTTTLKEGNIYTVIHSRVQPLYGNLGYKLLECKPENQEIYTEYYDA